MTRFNGKQLKYELIESGMSQRDLAKTIGVSEVSVSRYIKGEREPRKTIAVAIAKALCTTPEHLFGTEQYNNPDEAYGCARAKIQEHAFKWSHAQRKELIAMLFDAEKV